MDCWYRFRKDYKILPTPFLVPYILPLIVLTGLQRIVGGFGIADVTGGRMERQSVWESEDCSKFDGLLASVPL